MAISDEAYVTLQHWGIVGTDVRATPAAKSGITALGDPDVVFDMIPIMKLGTHNNLGGVTDDYYLSVINDVPFCHPESNYLDVVTINISKAANTLDCTISLKDASDNVVNSTTISGNFNLAHYEDQYVSPPISGEVCDVYLALIVFEDWQGKHANFTLANTFTDQRVGQYPILKAFNYQVYGNHVGFMDDYLEGQLGGVYYTGTPGGPGGEAGPSGSASGGDGLYTMPDYDIPYSALPSISVTDTGFVNLYKMSAAQLQALAADLWDANFFNSLAKNFSDPFDNIISLGIVPYPVSGTLQQVTIADYACPTSGEKLSSNYFLLDCGIIYMKHYFAHFGDYQIKFELYLPYCGTIQIDSSEIMDGSIGVQYKFDIFSGACMAEVKCYSGGSTHVLYSKEGNIRTELPISGRDYAEYYKGLISSIGTMVGGAAVGITGAYTGNTKMALGGAATSLAGGASLALNKPNTQRSGNISGSPGFMGIQYPYLIATIPNYFGGPDIGDKCGYVSNLPCTIGNETGYLSSEVDFEELVGISAPRPILERIKNALAEGIYIEEVL